jgi:hypothetical protein
VAPRHRPLSRLNNRRGRPAGRGRHRWPGRPKRGGAPTQGPTRPGAELTSGTSPRAPGDAAAAEGFHPQTCADGTCSPPGSPRPPHRSRARTPEDSIRWCDRQAKFQVLLWAQDGGILAERRAGLMVAAGDPLDPPSACFAGARLHPRRVGSPWPLMPTPASDAAGSPGPRRRRPRPGVERRGAPARPRTVGRPPG